MVFRALVITVDPQPNSYFLLESVKSWVGRSGLYRFSCRFCAMLCLICLNSESSSVVQVPFQCLVLCVISLRHFV